MRASRTYFGAAKFVQLQDGSSAGLRRLLWTMALAAGEEIG
jgi:hypothetical protein